MWVTDCFGAGPTLVMLRSVNKGVGGVIWPWASCVHGPSAFLSAKAHHTNYAVSKYLCRLTIRQVKTFIFKDNQPLHLKKEQARCVVLFVVILEMSQFEGQILWEVCPYR